MEPALEALLEKIIGSRFFSGGDSQRVALLRTLFLAQSKGKGPIAAKDLAALFGPNYTWNAIGVLVFSVRKSLKEYADSVEGSSDDWEFEIPDAKKHGGYELVPKRRLSATQKFWQPHSDCGDEVVIVCSQARKFLDSEHIVPTEIITGTESHMLEMYWHIKKAKREVYMPGEQLPELVHEPAGYSFCAAGEIAAATKISNWFQRKSIAKSRIALSDEIHPSEAHSQGYSLIILGEPFHNRFLRALVPDIYYSPKDVRGVRRFEAWFGGAVAFNPHIDHLGVVLASQRGEVTFNLSPRTIGFYELVHMEEFKRPPTAMEVTQLHHESCIVTRMRCPGQRRFLTLISGRDPRAIDRMADVLTSDWHVQELMREAQTSAEALKEEFQWLCLIDLNLAEKLPAHVFTNEP